MECEKKTVDVNRGRWNVIIGPRNVIMRPCNVNRGPSNVIMGPRNVIIGPCNVNRGPWNVNREQRILLGDSVM